MRRTELLQEILKLRFEEAYGGGRQSKTQPTQFGRAMQHLGIEMIAAYSPEARGRSELFFPTHQDRLVK